MLPAFLIPETTVHESGAGPVLDLGEHPSSSILLTLGITKTIEQESLIVGLYGSVDGSEWSPAPLAVFPQKFYEGVSSILLELAAHSGVRFLRVQWKTDRWGRGDKTPSFRLYVFAEPVLAESAPVTAG
jgi:hypothetical protein